MIIKCSILSPNLFTQNNILRLLLNTFSLKIAHIWLFNRFDHLWSFYAHNVLSWIMQWYIKYKIWSIQIYGTNHQNLCFLFEFFLCRIITCKIRKTYSACKWITDSMKDNFDLIWLFFGSLLKYLESNTEKH